MEQSKLSQFVVNFAVVAAFAIAVSSLIVYVAEQGKLKRIEGEILAQCVKKHRAYEIEKTEYGYSCVKYDEKGQKHSIEVGL